MNTAAVSAGILGLVFGSVAVSLTRARRPKPHRRSASTRSTDRLYKMARSRERPEFNPMLAV